VSPDPEDAFAAAQRIADGLAANNLPFAIEGSIAYGIWAPPRGTNDADLNILPSHRSFRSSSPHFVPWVPRLMSRSLSLE
jgi:hypothetical protein